MRDKKSDNERQAPPGREARNGEVGKLWRERWSAYRPPTQPPGSPEPTAPADPAHTTGEPAPDSVEHASRNRDEKRFLHSKDRAQMDRAVVADGLPLERLYARFDTIAKGRAHGDSSAAHRSIIERLAANQRRAEALGWTDFLLERLGGSGRLELRGARAEGRSRELVPDAIPYEMPARYDRLSAPEAEEDGR